MLAPGVRHSGYGMCVTWNDPGGGRTVLWLPSDFSVKVLVIVLLLLFFNSLPIWFFDIPSLNLYFI